MFYNVWSGLYISPLCAGPACWRLPRRRSESDQNGACAVLGQEVEWSCCSRRPHSGQASLQISTSYINSTDGFHVSTHSTAQLTMEVQATAAHWAECRTVL